MIESYFYPRIIIINPFFSNNINYVCIISYRCFKYIFIYEISFLYFPLAITSTISFASTEFRLSWTTKPVHQWNGGCIFTQYYIYPYVYIFIYMTYEKLYTMQKIVASNYIRPMAFIHAYCAQTIHKRH